MQPETIAPMAAAMADLAADDVATGGSRSGSAGYRASRYTLT
jgi:hypothetical protein